MRVSFSMNARTVKRCCGRSRVIAVSFVRTDQ
jgi:hypothetical protein